jgi:DNA polymerase
MEPLRTHIDFETRSLVDLPKLGEHAYARHWSTSPLMLTIGTAPRGQRPVFDIIDFFKVPGYAQNVYPALTEAQLEWTVFKVPCPPAILAAIARGDTFVAHNARFEQAIYFYICHKKWGWPLPDKWSCTAARSRYFGIRASLEGSASDLEVLSQKDERGKQFINDFCKPRKYVGPKKNGIVKELWYEPHENPAGWQAGLEYCVTDGQSEADIDNVLPDLPAFEQWAWEWDFQINTRGVPIDMQSVERAVRYSDHFTAAANKRFEEITALRPTQRDRVLEYLQQREEIEDLGDLRSKTLKRLVQAEFPQDLQDVIQIRLDASLASVKKLETMKRVADPRDGMARGGHLYGGAHTMRWSHKRIQTGNMKRGDKDIAAAMFAYLENDEWWPQIGDNGGPPLDIFDIAAQEAAHAGEKPAWVDAAEWRFIRPLASLSVSMKGFIKALPGHELIDVDYAQIEARVLAWLARCEWLLQAFRDKQDPYVKFGAEHMYKVNYDDCFVYVDGKRQVAKAFKRQRQIAKSAVLGAGFGLGKLKFVEYCDNSDLIITQEEADETITAYRDAHPEIVKLWARVEQCALAAVSNPGRVIELGGTGVKFYTWHIDTERYWLVREDPSGSCQHYYRPKIQLVQRYGRTVEQLTFRTEWNGKSYRESTYGGKLVENMVQKIARDILVAGGKVCEAAGYPSRMLVHDSNVTMPKLGHGSPEELARLACTHHDWYTDLPIEAEASRMQRYG